MSPPIRPIAGSQMAVFLLNSRLGLLCATHNTFTPWATLLPKLRVHFAAHFFRSYVCILPSSLTRVLSCALDFSSFLPVSVYGTVFISLALDSISWHPDYTRFASTFSPLPVTAHLRLRISLQPSSAYCFDRYYHSPAGFHLMRPAFDTYKGSGF